MLCNINLLYSRDDTTGKQGIPARNGTDGMKGEDGEKGEVGLKGQKGNVGEKGEEGQNGTDGEPVSWCYISKAHAFLVDLVEDRQLDVQLTQAERERESWVQSQT